MAERLWLDVRRIQIGSVQIRTSPEIVVVIDQHIGGGQSFAGIPEN